VEDALLPRDEKPDEGGVVQYSGHDTMEDMSIWAKLEKPSAGRDSVGRLQYRFVRLVIRIFSAAKMPGVELRARRMRGFQLLAASGVRMLKMGKSKTRLYQKTPI